MFHLVFYWIINHSHVLFCMTWLQWLPSNAAINSYPPKDLLQVYLLTLPQLELRSCIDIKMKGNNKLDNIFQDEFPAIDNDLEDNVPNNVVEPEPSIIFFNNEDGENDDESESSLILITDDGEEPESYSESMRSPSPDSFYSESMRSPSPESLPSECIFKFRPVKKEMVSNDLQREECDRLIGHAQELQNTLEVLSQRLDQVKEKNLKLKSEKMLLSQYIKTLMCASNMYSNAL